MMMLDTRKEITKCHRRKYKDTLIEDGIKEKTKVNENYILYGCCIIFKFTYLFYVELHL